MIARWIEFEGGPRRAAGEAMHVTINHKGMLLLNRKAWKSLGEPEAVTLLYDETNNMIGLRPADADCPKAFPVVPTAHSYVIRAHPFCAHFDFEIERTMVFNHVEIDDHGIMRLRLKTATGLTRRYKKGGH